MPPRTLTLRGVPDATLKRLRARAAANRRSLNGELLAILDTVADEPPASEGGSRVVQEPVTAPYAVRATSGLPVFDAVDQAALAEVCRRHHIRWLAVFGSHARGDARPESDVDLVVDFAPGKTPGFGLVRVAEALRPLFGGRRVDLLTRRGLSPRLRRSILNSARTLHAAE
jgi:predicted nucleotidyltransferase